jgi:glycerol-3-phosphate cytidylyltransferase-like family protein
MKITNQRDAKEAMKTFAKHYLQWLREFKENRIMIGETQTGNHRKEVEDILINHINQEIKRMENKRTKKQCGRETCYVKCMGRILMCAEYDTCTLEDKDSK